MQLLRGAEKLTSETVGDHDVLANLDGVHAESSLDRKRGQ